MSTRVAGAAMMLFLLSNFLVVHTNKAGDHSDAFDMVMRGASIQEAYAHQQKCGLPFFAEVKNNWDKLSALQQQEFQEQFSRPETDTYTVSSSGFFRIHYDTSGTHAPDLTDNGGNWIPDYIDSAAVAFDKSYNYHINILGYESPEEYGSVDPVTNDTIRYDVYVQNLMSGIYGETRWFGDRINDEEERVTRYRTYILVHNSYAGFPSPGIKGLQVTAAHEFHHAIQIGSYGNWLELDSQNSRFFYEITSTWLEDVVYPEINDYLYYLPVIFTNTVYNFPFYHSVGLHMYARAIWGHMMERRYDRDIMRTKWEYIRNMHPLEAINKALRDQGSTLEQELAEFNLWKFYTGTRARPDKYFIDGVEYPMLQEKSNMTHISETMFRGVDESTQTLHFHSIMTQEQEKVYFIVSNVDKAVNTENNFYELTIVSQPRANAIELGNDLWYRFEANNRSTWKVIPLYTGTPVVDERVTMYPNPFRTGQASSLTFVLDTDDDVRLSIFSSDMRLVYQDYIERSQAFGRTVYRWDVRDDRDRQVASGVYVYVLEYDDTVTKGKVTIIRE